jgi:C1A family cysteine protease
MPAISSLKGNPALVVEDQGDIGSCTANSSTTALEFELAKAGKTVQLSRLYLYARSRQFEHTPLAEDSGCEIRDVVKVLAKLGDVLESDWPYDLTKWTVNPPAALDLKAASYKPTQYVSCPTLVSIKACLASGHPVIGGFQVPENMMSEECAKTGVVKLPTPKEGWEGGHAVLFTGYNDKLKLLQFQNSWSKAWGDGGYGYLPYDFVTKGYADDFWTLRRLP